MVDRDTLEGFIQYAEGVDVPGLKIHQAIAAIGERLDGELITRATLLLDDPHSDTWEVGAVRELRETLKRKATKFGLPIVSLTLVPKSEADVIDAFAR